MKVVVAQKGAREHFLAARALHRRGLLAHLVVDWYALKSPVLRWFVEAVGRHLGVRLQAALAAHAPEIPNQLIRPNRLRGFLGKWKQTIHPTGDDPYERALDADIAFSKMVARLQFPPHDVFFGYSYMSLEVLEMEQQRRILTILDQIDPGPVHFRIVAEEMTRHPALAGPPQPFPTRYYDRLRREWDLADVIVVNSEWSREALMVEGVDPGKIEILPLAFEAEAEEVGSGCAGRADRPRSADLVPPARAANDRAYSSRPPGESGRGEAATPYPTSDLRPPSSDLSPLRVLWLGQVTPGKGIHYLIEAALMLEMELVHFDVVGPLGILPGAVAAAPKNMTFHGSVSRDRVAGWYQQSDVFVLPTLSDGFALTQLEALAHGVPVIATPNCGHVVEEGKTGFMVPARDAQALAEAVLRFVRTPGLAAEMGTHCRSAVKAYSVDAYGRRLVEIIEKWQAKRL